MTFQHQGVLNEPVVVPVVGVSDLEDLKTLVLLQIVLSRKHELELVRLVALQRHRNCNLTKTDKMLLTDQFDGLS